MSHIAIVLGILGGVFVGLVIACCVFAWWCKKGAEYLPPGGFKIW